MIAIKNLMKKTVLKAPLGKTLARGAVLAAVTLGLSGVASAVSFNSTATVTRTASAGTTFDVMSPFATTHCFLSQVKITETDSAGEFARCDFLIDSGNWVLLANLGVTSDTSVTCSANCYNN